MNILQANLTATLEGFRVDQAKLREDMALHREDAAKRDIEAASVAAKRDIEAASVAAKRDIEAAKRDKDNLRWQIGLWVAAVVIIGILVRWPAI